jgi:hypothetical protein
MCKNSLHYFNAGVLDANSQVVGLAPGADFSYIFFPRKITFHGKFRGISLKNDFSKLFFRGKFHFFPTFLGENFSAEFYPKFSPEKMYRPQVTKCISKTPVHMFYKADPKANNKGKGNPSVSNNFDFA